MEQREDDLREEDLRDGGEREGLRVADVGLLRARALDREGEPFTLEAEGLLAVCIQHEMDHLKGKVFVEYLSPLKRNRIRTKMVKQQRDEERA